MNRPLRPVKQGLYDPQFEHDACGVGFVVNIKGAKSHDIVRQALTVLINLDHRGARGCEPNTGDGAGILFQLPHKYFTKVVDFTLPAPGEYGVGMLFLPSDPAQRAACKAALEAIIREEGQRVLGWRDVSTDSSTLGETARLTEPSVAQVFIAPSADLDDSMAFERKLYVIRRRAENSIRHGGTIAGGETFYFPSLSARTIVYKGMLTPQQVEEFYPELSDPDIESALALVHSRFSTNTFPSWERAHPNRYLIHNGEINTLRGNVNWMHAREKVAKSDLFGEELARCLPIIDQDGSDSSMFDNCFEFLALAGRSLPHVAMMMVPAPWQNHESMSDEERAFYEYHSCLMEPWDGPASMAFTDGTVVGAILDRNGLRPSRYYVTSDDRIIMASEVGVLDIPDEQIVAKGRLQPGRMLLIDTEAQRIIADEEIKSRIAAEQPYRAWLDAHLRDIGSLPAPKHVPGTDFDSIIQRQFVFGYTQEDLRLTIAPMATEGVEPIGSMGVDTPLAVLSDKPQMLYSYFKQLFAQVTNPPIDSIREEIVTAMGSTVGPEGDLLHPGPENCKQIAIHGPLLTNEELAKLRELNEPGFKAITLPMLFDVERGGAGLAEAMEQMFRDADEAIAQGATFLIISDRGVNRKQAPIPALLATAGLHHHLVRGGTRTKVSLIVESAEPREVQHFALLVGYGAGAINPYFAFEVADDMIRQKLLPEGKSYDDVVAKIVKAGGKGVVKTMSKMGISTVQSYTGAQIFEALGINQEVIDRYFTWTPSRIGGIGLEEIAAEVGQRHRKAFPARELPLTPTLDSGGEYQWRDDGEYHLINPETVHYVQQASWQNDYTLYKQYAQLVNDQTRQFCTLRGMLDFVNTREPISLDEVEPIEAICARFKTGAMSFGSISQEAHEALAIAMNRIGGQSNTGEGGEDARRFCVDENGDSRCSSIKQVASGRFGVTSHYLVNAREIQIKMAQGAKPGEGGQLPGRKVYPWVAHVRGTTPGVGLISPPPHHDIYSIEDLAELIHDLKNANKHARISVKLVSEVGVGTIAAGVAKAHADVVLISGYDGGTGASPRSSIRHAGLPWELGLAETHQTLVLNNLRSRIKVEADGKMMTGRDVVVATLLGAEEFGFATIPLVVLGCVMMRVCHQDTCPVGIATQNPELRGCFKGDSSHVVNYMRFVAQEIREWMAAHGFRSMNEMVGRTDMLVQRDGITHWKAKGVDLAPLLYQPDVDAGIGRYCTVKQDHGLEKALDTQLEALCAPALERGEPVTATVPITNVNRVVGTMLGAEISRRYGAAGLPDGTIDLTFTGSAGQSFGAFVTRGVNMRLVGDANDYLGKGLCGGRITVTPPAACAFVPEDNIIIGNVAFFGATAGEAFIRGMAGERFCVRNSGVRAVVEGVGDHGCEYMTGGQVVILGQTGRNFAAGMSGGIAYVLDTAGDFPARCNMQMVETLRLDDQAEIAELRAVIEQHVAYTDSAVGQRVLADWENMVSRIVKVLPKDYSRMLSAIKRNTEAGLSDDDAVMAAFVENSRDVARVGGN